MNSDYKQAIQEEYEFLKQELKVSLDEIKKDTKLVLITHDATKSSANPFSIGFQPSTIKEARRFQDLLVEECLLRDIEIVGVTREHMRSTLTQHLQNEAKLTKLYTRLEQCTPNEGVSFVLLQWIPCIMHMETRIGVKILTMLLAEGLAHAKSSSHPKYQQTSSKSREEEFCAAVNNVINNSILGSGFNKWQFNVPIESSPAQGVGNVIGTILLENTKVRSLIDNIEQLIAVCLPPGEVERVNDWIQAVSNYQIVMKIFRKRKETTQMQS